MSFLLVCFKFLTYTKKEGGGGGRWGYDGICQDMLDISYDIESIKKEYEF